jgi:hypothetical protein
MIEADALREVAIQVSGYFRDFLDSDFKRKSAPRRRIVLQTDSGFRCGMRSRPYETLDAALWQLLQRPCGLIEPLHISPRQFTRSISPTLRKVIDQQIAQIKPEAMQQVRSAIEHEVYSTMDEGTKDPEGWIEGIQAQAAMEFADRVVRPLVQKLDEPMRRSRSLGGRPI